MFDCDDCCCCSVSVFDCIGVGVDGGGEGDLVDILWVWFGCGFVVDDEN